VPAGSFDLNPVPTQIANQALPVYVCLYDPTDEENPCTVLPNVRCLRIDYREGPEPPVARFQYFMDDLLQSTLGWPSQFEQLWPIDAQGNYVVLNDDRLVVLSEDPSGNSIVLFDGFAQVPQVDLSAQHQGVTFVALGVAIRLWDLPIDSRVQRNASATDTTDGSADVEIGLPCRWNPSDTSVAAMGGYIGNCVASADLSEVADNTYPVFLDPLVIERGELDTSYWYVSDALSYLIAVEPSPLDGSNTPYVVYPTIDSLKAILSCYAPPDDGLLNSSDATETDIQIRDYDATNKVVPDVFAELLRYCGFVMVFDTDTYPDGSPRTSLVIRRKDALSTTAPKPIYLAASGASSLNLSQNNATALHLARDCNDLVNQWAVETGLKQVEITIYLAPGFEPSAGDAANPKPFFISNLTTASSDQRRMYRWYIADECADGHWNVDSATWVEKAPDFSSIFPPATSGNATYVDRYRPGSTTLISKDAEGKPLKAILELAKGFASEDPALAEVDSEDTNWLTITHGWRLLDDRLGIEVTVENPDQWGSGNPKLNDIRSVLWSASPTAETNFLLRLTTVIESDQRMPIVANKRIASPTEFARQRTADGKDHFQYCSLAVSSLYYQSAGGDGTDPYVARDDTKAATTHAEQLRSAHEFPTLAGSVTIPFITDYYQIADRVQIIQGRGASLQINVGVDQGETATYPWVTALAWDFQGDRQQTVLQLSDHRAEPQGI
jgi:hypothetical protein